MHYLDYNATSPLHSYVKDEMIQVMDDFGNPSSVHSIGRKAKSILENAREKIADYLGVLPPNIIFTSSATEANHLLFRGIECDVIITSKAEHDSVLAAIALSNKPVYYIDHHQDGSLSSESFEEILKTIQQKYTKPLLSLMKVNNETGVIQNLSPFASTIREIGGLVHSDAVQAIGKIAFDNWSWQCDAMTLAAHKVGGPKGVGVLVLKDRISLNPLITGGGQEMRRRAGTENILPIHGFGALIDVIDIDNQKLSDFQKYLEKEIIQINPQAIIVGQDTQRVPNTICVITAGIEAEKQVIIADLNQVCVSSGSACSSGKVKSSHVLHAYHFSEEDAKSAIRISMGFLTEKKDCEAFLKAYQKIFNRVK